jgi:hypothetical protein
MAFSHVVDPATGRAVSWDADVTRLETAFSVRVTRHIDVRAAWQENWRPDAAPTRRGRPVAGLLCWF